METNSLTQCACFTVGKIPTAKQNQILADLAHQLSINPEDTNLHDIVKLEIGTDNLWYKIHSDDTLKFGLFIFSDKPIPTKIRFALDKLTTITSGKNKDNIMNVVVYSLMLAHSQAGGNITNTLDFTRSIIGRMLNNTDTKDAHSGGIFGNQDFRVLENILKEFTYKK